jgi:hypothetical protein
MTPTATTTDQTAKANEQIKSRAAVLVEEMEAELEHLRRIAADGYSADAHERVRYNTDGNGLFYVAGSRELPRAFNDYLDTL